MPNDAPRFVSLFAGIGGFDLGLGRANFHCVGQVEIDPYCQKVLKKHWPDVPIHDDIRTFDQKVWGEWGPIDLLCGGYPCQGFSLAGKREGENDERYLWPEFARCIREIRPRIALLENVPGHLSMGFGRVLGDLAEMGYDAEWGVLPAGAFGAHAPRSRLFVVAFCPDADSHRLQRREHRESGPWGTESFKALVQGEVQLSVSAGSRGGVSDGIPNRIHRLRAIGNAIVPACAEYVGRCVMRSFFDTGDA